MSLALMLASHDAISIVKGTTTFLTSRQSKWGTPWFILSCDTISIGITCHWNWCHLMPLASVSVSHDAYNINGTIIFLGQDDRSEVQHDYLGHMMPLAQASASCDANSIINGTIALLRSRWSKWSATWLSYHVMSLVTASHDADGFVSSTIIILMSRWSKWGRKWLFWSCNVISASFIWLVLCLS